MIYCTTYYINQSRHDLDSLSNVSICRRPQHPTHRNVVGVCKIDLNKFYDQSILKCLPIKLRKQIKGVILTLVLICMCITSRLSIDQVGILNT